MKYSGAGMKNTLETRLHNNRARIQNTTAISCMARQKNLTYTARQPHGHARKTHEKTLTRLCVYGAAKPSFKEADRRQRDAPRGNERRHHEETREFTTEGITPPTLEIQLALAARFQAGRETFESKMGHSEENKPTKYA